MTVGHERPKPVAWLSKLIEPNTLWLVLTAGIGLVLWAGSLNSRVGSLETTTAEYQRTVTSRIDAIDRELRDTSKAVAAIGPELRAIREMMMAGQQRDREVQERLIESLRAMDQRWQTTLAPLIGQPPQPRR